MKVIITVFGMVKIIAEATNRLLRAGHEVVFEIELSPTDYKDEKSFRAAIERKLQTEGHAKFVEHLKADIDARRFIGGTKWKAVPYDDYKVFSSMKTYQETAANGHLNDPGNLCNDIPFMLSLVRDAASGKEHGDPYFDEFLDNL